MTRKAKERRQGRVLEKQRATERRLQREQTLSGRSEWRALLRRIDGDDAAAQALVSPRHRVRATDPPLLSSSKAVVADTVQWKSTNVPVAAASVFQLPIKVDAPRATLSYEFSTQDFDISFGVHAIGASDGTMHELVPTARYESHREPVRGSLVLAGPAMALLVWDNSFSWLNTKPLAYAVELHQEFPEPIEPTVTPAKRAALALHERAKREQLRTHRETVSAELETKMQEQEQQIQSIHDQIEALRKALETTEQLKLQTAQEKDTVEEEIEVLNWEMEALLWRSMGASIIDKIFGFCDERELSAWSLTNHQWHSRVLAYRNTAVPVGDTTTAA